LSGIRALLSDLNPKLWLSPFAGRPAYHIVVLGVFYHALGLLLMGAGNRIASHVDAGYSPPGIPVSAASTLASGPIEEVIFFGIPYLVFSNPYVLLAAGSVWSFLHLFNTSVDFSSVSYGAFLFTVPHVFFSIRAWTGGRGWIAIAFHSGWNLAVLLLACGTGTISCLAFGEGGGFARDVLLIAISASVSALAYLSYKRKQRKFYPRRYYFAALSVLVAGAIPLVILDLASIL